MAAPKIFELLDGERLTVIIKGSPLTAIVIKKIVIRNPINLDELTWSLVDYK